MGRPLLQSLPKASMAPALATSGVPVAHRTELGCAGPQPSDTQPLED